MTKRVETVAERAQRLCEIIALGDSKRPKDRAEYAARQDELRKLMNDFQARAHLIARLVHTGDPRDLALFKQLQPRYHALLLGEEPRTNVRR